MPASFTTFAHFTVSEAMKRPNSSGLVCAASPPSVSKRFFVSADARITESSRSEEHTSELQSQSNLVCRLLLEKKKNQRIISQPQCAAYQTDYRASTVL